MAVRLWILGVFTLILAALWFWSLRSTPRRGLLLLVERLFLGIILCFLLSRIFLPMGISYPYGPRRFGADRPSGPARRAAGLFFWRELLTYSSNTSSLSMAA